MPGSRRWLMFLIVSSFIISASPCGAQSPPQVSTPVPSQTQSQNGQRLTLMEAENIAIQNHPRIQAAAQLALAAAAQVKEVQSAYYPQASGALTGAKAETNSRIAAGFLNSPSLFDKFAEGVHGDPALDGFWPDARVLQKFALSRAGAAGERGRDARRRVAARQFVLLRSFEGPVRPSSRRGNREGAPIGCGSNQRAGQEQSQVGPGCEFCKRGPGQSAAPAGASAKRFAVLVCATFRRTGLFGSADVPAWSTNPCRVLPLPMLRRSSSKRFRTGPRSSVKVWM